MNQALIPRSEKHIQVTGATGQPENAFLLKPLQYKIGKRMGIHQFLYFPNSPKSVLGRDLLENLEATIEFKEEKMKFKVSEEKLILALGSALESALTDSNIHLELILNRAYPGVWATDTPGRSKLAEPIKIELQTGVRPVVRKQYPLRLEDKKGTEPIINKF